MSTFCVTVQHPRLFRAKTRLCPTLGIYSPACYAHFQQATSLEPDTGDDFLTYHITRKKICAHSFNSFLFFFFMALFQSIFTERTDAFTSCIYVPADSRWIQIPTRWPQDEIQRCVRHHRHHGEDRGPKESVQRAGGRAAQADELCLGPHRPLWHHEAVLHQRVGKYVTECFQRSNINVYQWQWKIRTHYNVPFSTFSPFLNLIKLDHPKRCN